MPATERIIAGRLGAPRPLPPGECPTMVLAADEGAKVCVSVPFYPDHTSAGDVPLLLSCGLRATLIPGVPVELLEHGGEVVAMRLRGREILLPRVLRPALLRQSLGRQRWIFLFLLGPLLGVFLVNLIFVMSPLLWLAAGVVALFSLLLMMLLVLKDLGAAQRWTRSVRRTLAGQWPPCAAQGGADG